MFDLESNIDLELIKSNVPNYTSQKLSEMIVCDRYLGFSKDVAILCMEELSKRRQLGDQFDFESFIENSLKDLPKLDILTPSFKDILNKAIKFK